MEDMTRQMAQKRKEYEDQFEAEKKASKRLLPLASWVYKRSLLWVVIATSLLSAIAQSSILWRTCVHAGKHHFQQQ